MHACINLVSLYPSIHRELNRMPIPAQRSWTWTGGCRCPWSSSSTSRPYSNIKVQFNGRRNFKPSEKKNNTYKCSTQICNILSLPFWMFNSWPHGLCHYIFIKNVKFRLSTWVSLSRLVIWRCWWCRWWSCWLRWTISRHRLHHKIRILFMKCKYQFSKDSQDTTVKAKLTYVWD